ncbi:hypothetical protein ACFXKG_05505 [Streptomyces sp. NPDC059255]|uniref:hypothetical protein n=1 Tax=Streptomyces sp. NPDC059255 TaxID=3346793 RepID=UPI0036C79F01
MNSELPPRLAPLPVRLRPCLGESTDSYVRRLARANHLRPSFLHCYLSDPPLWFGKPLLEHLATVTGHSPEALERTLANADSPQRKNRPRPRIPRKNPFAWRHDLARRIAQEALKGTQVRLLAKRYNLRCSDIRLALETARPAISETSLMASPVRGELADLVESMIGRGLNGRQIWTELMDHHEYSVTYGSIRHYIRYARSRTPNYLGVRAEHVEAARRGPTSWSQGQTPDFANLPRPGPVEDGVVEPEIHHSREPGLAGGAETDEEDVDDDAGDAQAHDLGEGFAEEDSGGQGGQGDVLVAQIP